MNKYTSVSFGLLVVIVSSILIFLSITYVFTSWNSWQKILSDEEKRLSDEVEKKYEGYRIKRELRWKKYEQYRNYTLDYWKFAQYLNEYFEKSDLTREAFMSGFKADSFPKNIYREKGDNGGPWDISDGTYIILKPNIDCEKLKKLLAIVDLNIKYSENIHFDNKDWCLWENLWRTWDSILVFFSFTWAEELERYTAAKSFLKMHTTLIAYVVEDGDYPLF